MVNFQPSATFLLTGSSQLETDEDSNLFKTTLGDRHSSYNTASINADMLDGHGKDNSDALQAIPPKLLSHLARPSASPTHTPHLDDQDKDNQGNHSSYDTTSVDAEMLDALPTADNLNTGLINVLDDVAATPCLTPPTERHTSIAPSEISSTWNLSPVHDSRYIWSASSPPPTQSAAFCAGQPSDFQPTSSRPRHYAAGLAFPTPQAPRTTFSPSPTPKLSL
jgi:hypothetical protein